MTTLRFSVAIDVDEQAVAVTHTYPANPLRQALAAEIMAAVEDALRKWRVGTRSAASWSIRGRRPDCVT